MASSDANSNITFSPYDALDRHIATTNADGTTRKLIWSPRSNLVLTEDANGTVVSNSFDLLDRCVRRDITPAEGVSDATTFELFTYDGASRLVQASNNLSMIDFSHDSLGQCKAGKQDCIAVAAVFDGVGNRLSFPTRPAAWCSGPTMRSISPQR
ncbi:MAG: RHS repeat protein [Verrucomicrobia bacterium]|nr:RHS repeat protein [Verrucomicrobiota bacterium]